MTLTIHSWNVNGIRAVMRKGFTDYVQQYDPDILCLQETKTQEAQLKIESHFQYWSHAERKGYSGTAVLTRNEPHAVTYGIGSEHDGEGRVITCEFERIYLVNVYVPNAQEGLRRLSYRQQWDQDFLSYLKRLEQKKPVVVCGDFNVAHKEIDIARPRQNRRHAGFTDEERDGFDQFIRNGFVDTFRVFNNEPHNYTWWSYRAKARERNVGWRIDYILVSASLRDKLKDAFILSEVYGSDHCPVGLRLNV